MRVNPLHHTIVDRKTEPSGKTFRVILLRDGKFSPLINYFGTQKRRMHSYAWQINVARAVGMLLDYIFQLGLNYQGEDRARKLFWDFANAIERGTIPVSTGYDPSGLYWPAQKESRSRGILTAVRDFSQYCTDNYSAESLIPSRATTLQERIAYYRALDKKSINSFFAHLKNSGKNWRERSTTDDLTSSFSARASVVRTEPPRFNKKIFPTLVSQGFLKYGGERHEMPHLRYHIRDMMISLLQGGAGLRASEPFHLFVSDIEQDPLNPGHAKVKLYHPCEGIYRYLDALGREVVDTRQNYLRSIGLAPRNLDHRKNYHAGWKNLALFKDPFTGEIYAPVTFYPKSWGKIFWNLYRRYLFHVRPYDVCHPYLFVTEREGKNFGAPYSLKQYLRKHEIAVLKVTGKEAKKYEGTTSHGLRHMYGRAIKEAVGDRDQGIRVLQYCMRHRSIEAQEVYTAPSMNDVRQTLAQVETATMLSEFFSFGQPNLT